MPEGDDDFSVSMGEEGIVSGGVYDHGTQEEDGPGTWGAATLAAVLAGESPAGGAAQLPP